MKDYRDSLLKIVHNPGGHDCIQGKGPYQKHISNFLIMDLHFP